jgi:hypothetical protein
MQHLWGEMHANFSLGDSCGKEKRALREDKIEVEAKHTRYIKAFAEKPA